MSHGRCGTCKHWSEPNTGYRDYGPKVDNTGDEDFDTWYPRAEQRRVELNALYRRCERVPCNPDDEGDPPPLVYTIDGSEYQAELITRAEFGCVLHEPNGEPVTLLGSLLREQRAAGSLPLATDGDSRTPDFTDR